MSVSTCWTVSCVPLAWGQTPVGHLASRTDQVLSKEQVSLIAVSGETCPEPTSIWTKCR